MATAQKSPKQRILDAASELFYECGYQNTGINEIISHSKTHKASLYRHFKSKEELAKSYLECRGDIFAGYLTAMTERSKDPYHFFKLWQKSIIRMAKGKELHGCPLVNFNSQLGKDRDIFIEDITATHNRWADIIERFLKKEKRGGRIQSKASAQAMTRRIMMIYQGLLQLSLLQNDPDVLSLMADEMNEVVAA